MHLDEEVVRLNKLKSIEATGASTYPAESKRTHSIASVLNSFDSLIGSQTEITIAGRMLTLRMHGGSCFVDLKDSSGKIQLHFRKDVVGENAYAFLKEKFDHGDFIDASGRAVLTKVGERTIEITHFQLLSKTLLPLPDKFHGIADVELRYRERYLDLLANPDAMRIAITRISVVNALRRFLEERGFLEVETPVLQNEAGGAIARPFVTHHNALNIDLYLRIAPELYLKRLIVGGFEKVFEVARCFRNEGIDHAHNPEFTQVEFYWAYATYEDLMRLCEELVHTLVVKINGTSELSYRGQMLNFTPPFPRITFRDAVLEHTGIDIDIIKTESELRDSANELKISELDLTKTVGYGEVMDEFYKRAVRSNLTGPVFITDYPVEMVPLAKRCDYDASKAAITQLVVNGVELLKGYNELNDPLDQESRFMEQQKLGELGAEETMPIDHDFITALKHGMPPTAGCGIGIDRLAQVLVDAPNLKEVILFPTLRPE